ncbi:disease resistance protein RPV1-like [Apium graveolens]|uniref:disease resistance protein RPV1-like n=1 Tax=Apium graveolens TaxID=4045 RepID=UPI003D7AD056
MAMASEASFCHVFLSFKGETRDKFTCFLYDALRAEGFVAFMDKNDIRVGDGVDLTIREGIRNSMSAIIIFSPNYANSAWCLDELVLILERNRNSKYFVMPIFYEVEIGDIKHQLGKYGQALDKHRARHNDKVDRWREALVEVGNILGHRVEGPHNAFIRNTVKLFGEKLVTKFPERAISQGSSFSSWSSHKATKNKVILYTSSANDGQYGANSVARMYLTGGKVAFEERNCSKEPRYIRELEELLGNNRVRFPTVIVNGKDLCGEEEVEGLDNFMEKPTLIAMLNMYYTVQAGMS